MPSRKMQIVGGGSRNRLLNQFTADATGCTVLAGPVEATALGNLAMQMVGTGAVGIAERRAAASSIDRSRSSASRRATPIGGTRTTDDFNSTWS